MSLKDNILQEFKRALFTVDLIAQGAPLQPDPDSVQKVFDRLRHNCKVFKSESPQSRVVETTEGAYLLCVTCTQPVPPLACTPTFLLGVVVVAFNYFDDLQV